MVSVYSSSFSGDTSFWCFLNRSLRKACGRKARSHQSRSENITVSTSGLSNKGNTIGTPPVGTVQCVVVLREVHFSHSGFDRELKSGGVAQDRGEQLKVTATHPQGDWSRCVKKSDH